MPKHKLNMTIGRFMPFTKGHLNMVLEGDAPCIIYRINSSDKPIEKTKTGIKIGSKKYTNDTIKRIIEYIDNPIGELTEQEKELLKRPFSNELIDKEFEIIGRSYNKDVHSVVIVKNMFDALDQFNAYLTEHNDEYEPGYWMCGDDRVDEYSSIIDKYEELETSLGSKENIKNICKGNLKTNTGKGRTEGVSGTAVRKAILNKDKAAFNKIMPNGTDTLFDEFVKAFDDFKTQLQSIIKEHKMMNLKEYITERLRIDSKPDNTKNQKLSKETINEMIDELKQLGDKKNLTVKFRNTGTDAGDFCIFIYDKAKQKRYLVGYDGYWDTELEQYSFYSCYEYAKKFIDEY